PVVRRAGAADDAVDLVPFLEEELGEVRAVLASDTRNQCTFRHTRERRQYIAGSESGEDTEIAETVNAEAQRRRGVAELRPRGSAFIPSRRPLPTPRAPRARKRWPLRHNTRFRSRRPPRSTR